MTRTIPDRSPDNTEAAGLDIADAAARLGLSTETVRKRLQRGKLKGFKGADGAWRVVLPEPDQAAGQSQDSKPDAIPDSSPDSHGPLVAALKDEITFLRSQLQARDEEIRRAHVLIQQAQKQPMPLLPGERLPWWKRLFG
jgi:hypothetical protein